jgi:copper(I)-binding protein
VKPGQDSALLTITHIHEENTVKKTFAALSALTLAAGLGLTACGGSTDSADNTADTTEAAETTHAGNGIMVHEAWIKATDSEMTALFGDVMNHSDEDRTIVSASSDVAGMVELHETVADNSGGTMMQEKKGGFPLPAGKSKTLEPGGDHVMLMALNKELEAGDTVTVTLTFDDDSTTKVTAPVKPFSGAQETYAPSDEAAHHG